MPSPQKWIVTLTKCFFPSATHTQRQKEESNPYSPIGDELTRLHTGIINMGAKVNLVNKNSLTLSVAIQPDQGNLKSIARYLVSCIYHLCLQDQEPSTDAEELADLTLIKIPSTLESKNSLPHRWFEKNEAPINFRS